VAHTLSANKRIRQSEARRAKNKSEKSKMKTSIKKYTSALSTGDVQTAETALRNGISAIYKVAGKGVIHKNQAARRASRMTKKLNALKAIK
jgi:small subunit ribosomal protein S20